MKKLLEISFKGTEELIRLAEERANILRQNVETAVANTVLLGVARIANDCPVDTGRARASLAGDLADVAGVDLQGEQQTIAEGRAQSLTGFNGMEGRIGSNVEYILYLEYGHKTTGPKKLTQKQLRYLFAVGILKADSAGRVIPGGDNSIHLRINRRAGIVGSVKGKGFFRKNIPILQRHLNQEMGKAIQQTGEGKLLRKGA